MALPSALTDLRSYTFHLTPHAPGCGGASVGSEKRNRFMAAAPERAMRSVLTRLRMAPEQVFVRTSAEGDPEICRNADEAPLCLIWDGLNRPEAVEVINHLALAGWRPERIDPLPAPQMQDAA